MNKIALELLLELADACESKMKQDSNREMISKAYEGVSDIIVNAVEARNIIKNGD